QIRADQRRRLPFASLILFDRADQRIERLSLIGDVAEIGPGVQEQKTGLGLRVLQEHWNYRKPAAPFAFRLDLQFESKEHLALLRSGKLGIPDDGARSSRLPACPAKS